MYTGDKEAGVILTNLIVADGEGFVTYVETGEARLTSADMSYIIGEVIHGCFPQLY